MAIVTSVIFLKFQLSSLGNKLFEDKDVFITFSNMISPKQKGKCEMHLNDAINSNLSMYDVST